DRGTWWNVRQTSSRAGVLKRQDRRRHTTSNFFSALTSRSAASPRSPCPAEAPLMLAPPYAGVDDPGGAAHHPDQYGSIHRVIVTAWLSRQSINPVETFRRQIEEPKKRESFAAGWSRPAATSALPEGQP